MIDGRRVLALLAARGGSKGLPGKNILDFAGSPLIHWSIRAAQGSAYVDRIVLTTDDPAIAEVAKAGGCEVPFMRPPELATDSARSIDAIHHAMDWLSAAGDHFDYLVLLQPTSPLRIAEDIDACVRECHDTGATTVISLCESPKSPYWMFRRTEEGGLAPIMGEINAARRQELPTAYVPNGAVYVARWEKLRAIESFIAPDMRGITMPTERSIDIDTKLDMFIAEALMKGII
jgi:N-acylneuraminate cytidylyltransferase